MNKYFGTDGIRGEVGEFLTPEFILKIGLGAGAVFKKIGITEICIGQDSRISSEFINEILSGALISMGITVNDLGVTSTPSISYTIINNEKIKSGIMVSASHNPYKDNGIKFFGENGKKISDNVESLIEKAIDEEHNIDLENVGTKNKSYNFVDDYIQFLIKNGSSLKSKRIGLDLANGSATKVAKKVFDELGATSYVLGNEANGYNINLNLGSTCPKKMQELVIKEKLDYAFCYDGDADRVQLIDSTGTLLDGDYIIYILAKYLKKNNKLKNNNIISTIMSNIGFKKAIAELGIENIETKVGDRFVMQEIDANESSLGGEQSGHIILPDLIPTGDGILTSVILSNIFQGEEGNFNVLKSEMMKFPQKLVNYKCENKNEIMNNKDFLDYISEWNQKLNSTGRVLVRPSGTEELIRVMVELPTIEECDNIIEKIIEKIKNL